MIEEVIRSESAKLIGSILDVFRESLHAHVDAMFEDGDPVAAVSERRESPKAAKVAKKASSSGRLARRTPEQIAELIGKVVEVVAASPDGLRSEGIRGSLKLEAKEMPRILREAIAAKALRIVSGQKRATTYGLPSTSKKTKKTKKAKK